ncbi:MAG TPA: TonB-dependent receptor [Novosphingobium sp.]|nr:TonB-dependent receptor [Novosphingobium sp.]
MIAALWAGCLGTAAQARAGEAAAHEAAADEAGADNAGASEAPAAQGDILVTAERRSSKLQSTALAITVLPSNILDSANVQDVTDLSGMAPGLTVRKTGGRETVPSIRGIGSGTPENPGSTAPGVAMFIDGVYVGDSVSLGHSLFDLDHMEVMRGPQGTLYGVSAIGGALLLVSNQPKLDKISGNFDVSLGDYNYIRARGAINVPLSDTVAVRLSGQRLSHDGFTTNTVNPGYDLDDADDTAVKGAVLWQPSSTFSATLTGEWTRQHDHGPAQKWLNDPNPDPRVLSQDYLSKNYYKSTMVHLNLNWDLPVFSIRSVSAYRSYKSEFAENVTFTTFDRYGAYEYVPTWNHNEESASEEIDFISKPGSKLSWTAGVFFMRRVAKDYTLEYYGTNASDATPAYVDPSTPSADIPSNLSYGNWTRDVRLVVEPFVQFSYPVTDKLKLTAGARYNYESHDHLSHNFSEYGNDPLFGLKDETSVPTWRAELAYTLSPQNMVYVSAATGYKAGGANGNAGTALVPYTFKDEHNTAFEIGSKNFFFDKKLRLNMAGFFYIYKNMQYIETDPIPFDQGMSNIPLVHIWGGEAEASYTGMAGRLHINGNLTVEQGKVVSHTNVLYPTIVNNAYSSVGACAYGGQYYSSSCWAGVIASAKDIYGNTPPNMPEISASLDVSYDIAFMGGKLTPWIQYVHVGARQARIFNEAYLDHEPAYNLINLSLAYEPPHSRFHLALSVSNATDVAGVSSRYTSPYEQGLTSQQYIPPRQIIGTIGYSF